MSRQRLRRGRAVAVLLLLCLLPPAPAGAQTPALSGRVHAAGDTAAAGFAGVGVLAYHEDTETFFSTETGGDGSYAFAAADLPTGAYVVSASGGPLTLPHRYTPGTADAGQAAVVQVATGQSAVADVVYTGVRGVVTTSAAAPPDDIRVVALPATQPTPIREARATATGHYFLAIDPGSYRLRFRATRATPQATGFQWHPGVAEPVAATPVAVTATAVTSANAHFSAIAGSMLGPDGGVLPNATAAAGSRGVAGPGEPLPPVSEVSTGKTDGTGAYELLTPPGGYVVKFTSGAVDGLKGEYYHPGVRWQTNADVVDVGAATRVTGIDGRFRTITGTLQNWDGSPAADDAALAWDAATDDPWYLPTPWSPTDPAGGFKMLVWPGRFRLSAESWRAGATYLTWYGGGNKAAATDVDTTAGNVAGIAMQYRVIRGHVRREDGTSLTDLSGVKVTAGPRGHGDDWFAGGQATTDAAGYYEIGVPDGSYEVRFAGVRAVTGRRWVRYYDGATCPSTATPVSVGPSSIAGVDALQRPPAGDALITGSVTGPTDPATGSPADVAGCVTARSGDDTYAGAIEPDGRYAVDVPAGTYEVEFDVTAAGVTGTDAAQVVVDPAGTVAVDRTFGEVAGAVTLPAATTGTVLLGGMGTATRPTEVPVAGDGTYRALVPAGDYTVTFRARRGSGATRAEGWAHAGGPATAAADGLAVDAGGAAGVDGAFSLLRGRALDAEGAPVPGVAVGVRADGQQRGFATTGDDGRFAVPAAAGIFAVGFEHAPAGEARTVAGVDVSPPHDRTGVDVVLSNPTSLTAAANRAKVSFGQRATIGGRLTDHAGAGMAGQAVRVQRRTLSVKGIWSSWSAMATATTTSTGGYQHSATPAVPTQFRALFDGGQFSGSSTTKATATVNVAATATAALSATRIKPGAAVSLTGVVAPKLAGHTVHLQRKSGTTWKDVAKTTVSRAGAYRVAWKVPKAGLYAYRLRVPAAKLYLAGLSPAVSLRVR